MMDMVDGNQKLFRKSPVNSLANLLQLCFENTKGLE